MRRLAYELAFGSGLWVGVMAILGDARTCTFLFERPWLWGYRLGAALLAASEVIRPPGPGRVPSHIVISVSVTLLLFSLRPVRRAFGIRP